MLSTRRKVALGGALAGLALLALSAGPLFAQQQPTPTPGAALTHEQMDQLMDTMHGQGTSQSMHQAMGQGDEQRGEQLMQQCLDTANAMGSMSGMMGGTSGMMGGTSGTGSSMSGMMGGTSGMMGGTSGMMGSASGMMGRR